MAKVYEALIIKGKKTIDDVPAKIREEVRQLLLEDGYNDLATGAKG